MNAQDAAPSPMLFFEAVNAYQRTAAIKAAVELEVFTALAEGNTTAETAAARCGAAERGMRILLDYLVIMGFLTKADGHYRLTQDSAMFLDKRKPSYVGGALEFLLSPTLVAAHHNLSEAVRKGGTVLPAEGTVSPENPVWVNFARAMMPLMMMPAQGIAKLINFDAGRAVKILDIAAGHGIFGIAFAQTYPNAQVVALDWPQVLEVALENAQRFGVADRYATLPGSAFELNWGSGYDLILLTNFLHHFDQATCESLLGKAYAALSEGGRVVTLEFIPNEDRVTPSPAAAFAMTMLSSTPAGDAYTALEYERMFRHAGFARSEFYTLPSTVEQVVVSYK
jgi:ubiquinone/menaquinone biosynthesis C-methylase UbiE